MVKVMVRVREGEIGRELHEKGLGWVGREVSKKVRVGDQRPSRSKVLFCFKIWRKGIRKEMSY